MVTMIGQCSVIRCHPCLGFPLHMTLQLLVILIMVPLIHLHIKLEFCLPEFGYVIVFDEQVGAAFEQHLAALQAGQPRPRIPVLPPPTFPLPQLPNGQSLLPTVRPPVLPRPTTGPPGYGVSMGMPPTLRPPGAAVTSPPGVSQSNGLPRPPTLIPPVSTGLRPSTPTSSPMSNGLISNPPISGPPGTYQNQPQNSIPTSGAYGTYSYAAVPVSFSQQSTSAGLPNPTYTIQNS